MEVQKNIDLYNMECTHNALNKCSLYCLYWHQRPGWQKGVQLSLFTPKLDKERIERVSNFLWSSQ